MLTENVSPAPSAPESKLPSAATTWWTAEPLLVKRIVSPGAADTVVGENSKSSIDTSTVAALAEVAARPAMSADAASGASDHEKSLLRTGRSLEGALMLEGGELCAAKVGAPEARAAQECSGTCATRSPRPDHLFDRTLASNAPV